MTDQIDLTIGYDTASLTTPGIRYTGPVTTDHYGRKVPKHAHGTRHLGRRTQSAKVILDAAMALFDRIVNPALLVRRVNIVALHILVGQEELPVPEVEQLDLFTDYAKLEQERLAEQARLEREAESSRRRCPSRGNSAKTLGKGHGFAGGRHRHDPQQPDRRA